MLFYSLKYNGCWNTFYDDFGPVMEEGDLNLKKKKSEVEEKELEQRPCPLQELS